MDLREKEYVVIVQCDIVQERCSGYYCEAAFHQRTGGFADYPNDKAYRVINMTCGGCCGRALHRKLGDLVRTARKRAGIGKERMVIQLSSCITLDNYHAPPCPHLEYLKTLIAKVGLDVLENTSLSEESEERRQKGLYAGRAS